MQPCGVPSGVHGCHCQTCFFFVYSLLYDFISLLEKSRLISCSTVVSHYCNQYHQTPCNHFISSTLRNNLHSLWYYQILMSLQYINLPVQHITFLLPSTKFFLLYTTHPPCCFVVFSVLPYLSLLTLSQHCFSIVQTTCYLNISALCFCMLF